MEIGSVYQLDHSKLPENILAQLGFIRAVMVSKKSKVRVSVAFPSKPSLEKFFGRNDSWLLQPNLDSVYAMEIALAESVLCHRIPFEEFAAQRGTRTFWVNHHFQSDKSNGDCVGGVSDGLAGWGLRRRIRFVMKHRDNNEAPVSVQGEAMEEEDHGMEGQTQLRSGNQKPSKLVTYARKKKKRGPNEVALSKSDKCSELISETSLRWTQERYVSPVAFNFP